MTMRAGPPPCVHACCPVMGASFPTRISHNTPIGGRTLRFCGSRDRPSGAHSDRTGSSEIGRPSRVGTARPQHPPGGPAGCPGRTVQTPAEVGDAAVSLGVVTPAAGGDDVLPDVGSAPAAG